MGASSESAYPVLERNWNSDREEWEYYLVGGLTKREYYAAMAMQGIAANADESFVNCSLAVEIADALISELEKPHE